MKTTLPTTRKIRSKFQNRPLLGLERLEPDPADGAAALGSQQSVLFVDLFDRLREEHVGLWLDLAGLLVVLVLLPVTEGRLVAVAAGVGRVHRRVPQVATQVLLEVALMVEGPDATLAPAKNQKCQLGVVNFLECSSSNAWAIH